MPFPVPDLDDRSFKDLRKQAIEAAARACPEWTDRSASDPMIALIESAAFLTDLLVYRVNRMPEKAYVAFLNVIGARIAPPAAAVAQVRFSRKSGVTGALELPAGTRIKCNGSDAIFVLARVAKIPAKAESVVAPALHCTLVEGELLGTSSGLPGQQFRLASAPVIAETGLGPDLVIGIEQARGELPDGAASRELGGKAYRLWQEVESFSGVDPVALAYICDRNEGSINFAPALQGAASSGGPSLASIPPAGREIRAWYRSGGGAAGNLASHSLNAIDGANPGVDVDNPERAAGGRDAESLEDALARGPHALRSMDTAVTARDFERAALGTRAAARARAIASSQVWRHGEPGTVEIQFIPWVDDKVPAAQRSRASTVETHQSEEIAQRVQQMLSRRAPLGVRTAVAWTRMRTVVVQLRIACFREEDPAAVRARIEESIYKAISPFAPREFGQPMRASEIHELVAREPGVRYVDRLRFTVDETPKVATRDIRMDNFQPRTWHAASGSTFFRSMDDGDSWCATLRLDPADTALMCRPHPSLAGHLVAASARPDGSSAIHYSRDCGETWTRDAAGLAFGVNDLAWSPSADAPEIYLATTKGLFAHSPVKPDAPRRIVVIEDDDKYGFWAVATAPPIHGAATVAVAAGQRKGVWVSTAGAQSNEFRISGLQNFNVRVLEAQWLDGRAFLWAGHGAEAGANGDGCARIELRGNEPDPAGWQQLPAGWKGGSCHALAFAGEQVLAATNRMGVLRLASGQTEQGWVAGQIDNGLPIRDEQRLLHEVLSIAARPQPDGSVLAMACGPVGVFRSRDGGTEYQDAARVAFEEFVAIPEGWLFASGAHEIEVVSDASSGAAGT